MYTRKTILLRVFLISILLISLFLFFYYAPNMILKLSQQKADEYMMANGSIAIEEGTVTSKQYVSGHYDTHWILFYYSNTFVPEEWEIELQRYDSASRKWETASIDVDKSTYDSLSIGKQYKDPLSRSTYFSYDQ